MAGWGLSEALLIGLHIPRTLVLLSGTLQSLLLHKCQMFLLPTFSISSPAHNNWWCRSGSARRWLTSLMTADSTCWSNVCLREIGSHVCPPLYNFITWDILAFFFSHHISVVIRRKKKIQLLGEKYLADVKGIKGSKVAINCWLAQRVAPPQTDSSDGCM